ncbi:hypothetical protein [Gordonia sputi]
METTTHVPVVVGLGKAVHIAEGKGTRCSPKVRGGVAEVPHEQVTCKRCLKFAATTWATEAPAAITTSTEAKRSGKKAPAACACGCSEVTSGGRYRPGHDARHAGNLVRAVLAGQVEMADALDAVASDALRAKITRGVERAAQKGAAA